MHNKTIYLAFSAVFYVLIISSPAKTWAYTRMFYQFGLESMYGSLDILERVPIARNAGDLDKDGFPDIVVGRPYAGDNDYAGGVAALSGKNGKTLWYVSGKPKQYLGSSLATGSDFNGDGFLDVVVGAPFDSQVAESAGRVEILSGKDGASLFSIVESQKNQFLGTSALVGSDIDHDGVSEIIVGGNSTNSKTPGQQTPNRINVYSGKTGALLYSLTTPLGGSRFGATLASLGDADGDGVIDFAAGLPINHFSMAVPQVIAYSGATGSQLWVTNGSGGSAFGYSIDAAGDLNGDGKTDLIVGTPKWCVFTQDCQGEAFVLSGSTGQILHSMTKNKYADRFGVSVAGVGDLNGDGYPDLAVGTPYDDDPTTTGASEGSDEGSVTLFSGKTFEVLTVNGNSGVLYGQKGAGHFGAYITGLGDINHDSIPDFLGVGRGVPVSPGQTLSAYFEIISGADVTPMGAGCGFQKLVLSGMIQGFLPEKGLVIKGSSAQPSSWVHLFVGIPQTKASLTIQNGCDWFISANQMLEVGGTQADSSGNWVIYMEHFREVIFASQNLSWDKPLALQAVSAGGISNALYFSDLDFFSISGK